MAETVERPPTVVRRRLQRTAARRAVPAQAVERAQRPRATAAQVLSVQRARKAQPERARVVQVQLVQRVQAQSVVPVVRATAVRAV
jgi:hypothetical protein